ncbi:uncharacterized protein HD556DRAFT_1443312 [Suillus plorans]|uniref:DRBM domain-containing protein n=1 Tax=Suillus plorans TaxID=116603 RepID=A0A9P7DIC5_9AGAM|nr:uncharacterized protein HD556DRAFT_1443312 [Suillus plorans]KAG1793935.1 hypothetical protein HD556DRAFT_1443312 [Suillus plorans]
MSSHFVMHLNNIMQAKYGVSSTSRIKYEETPSGPQNTIVWTVTYFINDMKYGEASATSKKAAKEAAAQKTIDMLEAED